MSSHTYTPQGVCARSIAFDMNDGKIENLAFTGGCDGNLKAIAKLVEGKDAEYVASLLEGNTCGRRNTSCADQFAKAIREAKGQES